MDTLLKILAQSAVAAPYAAELRNRQYGLIRAQCTDNQPPTDKPRYIKVTTAAKAGLTQTDWIQPMRLIPYYDPPMPKIGDTVIVAAIDGDPHDLCWLGNVQNDTNPSFDQENPVADNSQAIPGHSTETVGGNHTETVVGKREISVQQEETRRTGKDLTVTVGKRLTICNDAGASLTLHESGAILLADAYGNRLTLGGASGALGETSDFIWRAQSDCTWNLNGHALKLENAADVTIQGKSAIVLGSTDSGGDTNNTRGYSGAAPVTPPATEND